MKIDKLGEYLEFATDTAFLAGRLTHGYFQTEIKVEYKSDCTPVTIADREAEEYIRMRIGERYPDHAIVGEEYGPTEEQDVTHRWFIDPIDGTIAFMHGVPLFATLIGLEIEGIVKVGVAYFPALNEMISAASMLGCWWNGRRAQVSKIHDLKQATVTCSNTQNFLKADRSLEWERILNTFYYQAGWGDAYGYLLVATGRVELMLDPIMNAWDCAPFLPILKEAGGYFGDWVGNETIYNNESMATTQTLLGEVLRLIQANEDLRNNQGYQK